MHATSEPAALRRLSHIEHFSSTRHHLGIYRCVTVTCRYQASASSLESQLDAATLYPALARVIADQPMLRVGILDQDTNAARFSHVKKIDLRNHATFSTIGCQTAKQYEDLLAEQQGWHHDQLWLELETRPPWRVAVVQPSDKVKQGMRSWDLVFAFHHSLMDGTSGRRFHELLMSALNSPSQPTDFSAEEPHLLYFLDTPNLPEAQEDVIPFKNSLSYVVKTLWNELGPRPLRSRKIIPWHGKSINFDLPYKTRVRPVDIPHEVVKTLLQACREHSTSLTGLFQALALLSYASHLPASEAKSFAASTPINLRPYLSPSADPNLGNLLCCLITSFSLEYPTDVVNMLRQPGADIDALLWQNAQKIKHEIVQKLASLPKDDINGLMKYVGDWFDFWEKKRGRNRTESWEVSNIGVLAKPGGDATWSIIRVMFTNGSMVAGPAIGINIASAEEGALTATISWQDTVVPDDLVDALERDLASYTKRLHETGKFAT